MTEPLSDVELSRVRGWVASGRTAWPMGLVVRLLARLDAAEAERDDLAERLRFWSL